MKGTGMKQLMVAAILAGVMVPSTAVFGEDAYIENMGGQFLNTGYCVCTNTRIEIDFQMLEIGSNKYLFSSATGNQTGYKDNLECSVYLGGASTMMFSFYTCTNEFSDVATLTSSSGLRCGKNLYKADTNRHVIVVDFMRTDKHFQVWNAAFTSMLSSWDVPKPFLANHRSSVPLGLFCRCYRNSGIFGRKTSEKETMYAYSTKMKVYSMKIYEGGSESENLVMHLVPCVKGGVAGFKDLCRPGRFVQGEIDGACTAGGDVEVIPDDPYLYTPKNTLSAVAGKSVFLDTFYTVKPTTRVELDYAMLTPNWATNSLFSNKTDPYLIGALGIANGGATTNVFYFYADGDNKATGFYRYGIGAAWDRNLTECSIDNAYNIRRTVSMNSNSVSLITAGYTNWTATVAEGMEVAHDLTTYTLKIGASYTGLTRFLPMKMYGLKIYESDVLVKDYRPFVTNSVPRFVNALDETDELYPFTLKGSRTDGRIIATNMVFEAGGAITDDPVEKEAYLEFDGVNGHRIDTDYSISGKTCLEIDFAPWNTPYNGGFDMLGHGDNTATNTIVWARLYCVTSYNYGWYFTDGLTSAPSGTGLGVAVSNKRIQVKLDGHNSEVIVTSGGKTLKNLNISGSHDAPAGQRHNNKQNLYIGASYSGGTRSSCIRLYSFKISEAGVLTRHYVPCTHEGQAGLYDLCEGKFYPLTGGKVYGKSYTGQIDDFEVALPQTAKITKGTGSYELSCIAPGASSFEWYENGKLIEGATTDSYTVEWTHKAPHTRTYKVVPVYTVFNEKVRGEATEAQVELTPLGIVIEIQ